MRRQTVGLGIHLEQNGCYWRSVSLRISTSNSPPVLPCETLNAASCTIRAAPSSSILGRKRGLTLALRAVIFDYGMVLSGPPDPKAHAALMRITGLPAEKLDPLYWADRHAFDEGKLTGEAYWRDILRQAGLTLSPSAVTELMQWDARMWMTLNPAMLAWQGALKASGFLTAILSNIGDSVQQAMEREIKWLTRFDVLVWSYQLRMAKPDPAIYRYTLDKLGRPARGNALHRRSRSECRSCRGAGHEGAALHHRRPTPRRLDRAIPRQGTPSARHRLIRSSRSVVRLVPSSLVPCLYDAIPSPTRFAAAMITRIPAHSSRSGRVNPRPSTRRAPIPRSRRRARTGSCAASSSHTPGSTEYGLRPTNRRRTAGTT